MQQVLLQTPDGRGMRPPYPFPHHPPAPPRCQHSPLASAPPLTGQHLMMVLPHSPQVKINLGQIKTLNIKTLNITTLNIKTLNITMQK